MSLESWVKYYPSVRGVSQIPLFESLLDTVEEWSGGIWFFHANSELALVFLLSELIPDTVRNFLAHLEEMCLKVLLGVEIKTLWHFSKSVSIIFLVENYNKISKDFEALCSTALPPYSRSLLLFLLLHCVYRPQLWSSFLCVRHHRNGLYVTVLATMTEHFSMERQKRVAEATETCCDLCKVIQWAAGTGP